MAKPRHVQTTYFASVAPRVSKKIKKTRSVSLRGAALAAFARLLADEAASALIVADARSMKLRRVQGRILVSLGRKSW